MSSIIESIERRQLSRVPSFAPGDRVKVHFQVIEGERRRTQVFEGVVIKRQGSGARETFTVRKQSFGVGVERTFPVHSPKVEKLEVVARGAVRRAKLYYLRDRVGKRARVAERRWGIEDDLVIAEEEEPTAVDAEGETVAEAETIEPEEGEAGEGEGETQSDEAKGDEQPASGGGQGAEPQAEAVEGEPPAEGDEPPAEADEPEPATEAPEAESTEPQAEGADEPETESEGDEPKSSEA